MNELVLTRWKNQYHMIEIPEELDTTVRNAIYQTTMHKKHKPFRTVLITAAAVICLFIVSINALPAFAASMQDVPVLGAVVDVLTFTHFSASSDERAYKLNIDVPQVQGLPDTALQTSLNEQYLAEAKDLYNSFMDEIGGLTDGQLAHQALDAGYLVKVSTDDLLVIEHWKVETGASGAESVKYDTIDIANQVLLTLPGLFRDDGYVVTITTNIKEQMAEQMETGADQGVMYFMDEDDPYAFHQIDANQTFYISADHKLVIVFDEYAVAPGAMGVVEFTIPTEVIAGELAGSAYIR